MTRLLATANTKLFIGPAMEYNGAAFTAASFSAITTGWTRILGTTNLGGAGDTAELISSVQVDSGDLDNARTRKAKGSRNSGTMELVCDVDYSDPGQIALISAEKTADTFAIKIEFNDAPIGGTPSTRLFVALVMSAREVFDEANSVVRLAATLEIDSNIVRVAAAGA